MLPLLHLLRKKYATAFALMSGLCYATGFLGAQFQAARMNLGRAELVHGGYLLIGGILLAPLIFLGLVFLQYLRVPKPATAWSRFKFGVSIGALVIGFSIACKFSCEIERSYPWPWWGPPLFILGACIPFTLIVFLPWIQKFFHAGVLWACIVIIGFLYIQSSSTLCMLIIPQSWGGAKAQVVRLHLTADAKPLFDLKPTDIWTPDITLHMSTDKELALELPDHTPIVLPRSQVITIAYPAPATPEPRP